MIWLQLLGWGKFVLQAALSVFKRYPLYCALVIALCACAWLLRGARHDLDKARATIAAMEQASKEARAKQIAVNKAAEQHYKEQADEADNRYRAALADSRAVVARYAAAHRLRPEGGFGPASGTAEGDGPRLPENPAPMPFVAVSDADLNRCDADYTYARAAHEWAKGLAAPPSQTP